MKLRVLHCSSLTVLNARRTGCTVLLKDKIVVNDVIIASNNFVKIVIIFYSPASGRQIKQNTKYNDNEKKNNN